MPLVVEAPELGIDVAETFTGKSREEGCGWVGKLKRGSAAEPKQIKYRCRIQHPSLDHIILSISLHSINDF